MGEAGKTAEPKPIQDSYHLRDSARQYLDAVAKIERDTAQAVKLLYESLRQQLDTLRQQRQYQATPDSTGESMWVPHYKDYIQPS